MFWTRNSESAEELCLEEERVIILPQENLLMFFKFMNL